LEHLRNRSGRNIPDSAIVKAGSSGIQSRFTSKGPETKLGPPAYPQGFPHFVEIEQVVKVKL